MQTTPAYPLYEIWGNEVNDTDNAPARFREDCFTLTEAKDARAEWQLNGRSAWIVDKETGEALRVARLWRVHYGQ